MVILADLTVIFFNILNYKTAEEQNWHFTWFLLKKETKVDHALPGRLSRETSN